jgi:hypothetical protein
MPRVTVGPSTPGFSPAIPFDRKRQSALVVRIRSEFEEMPGLQLTLTQAQRLFDLDAAICEGVLRECVRAGWLALTASGFYKRKDAEA